MASQTVTPSAQSIFKSQIFGRSRSIRSTARISQNARTIPTRRPTRIPLLLLPRLLPLPPHSLQVRHRALLSHPRLPSLLRPRPPPISPPMSSVADSNPADTTTTVRVVVKGRVQGVFYRNWTVENAKQLGLKGWVRNRRDGSVEALFSGSPDKVKEMEERCRRGPPDAMVTKLEVSPCSDDPGTGFDRRPTA